MWNSRDGGIGEGRDQGFSSTINLIPWGITYMQEHKLNISVTYNSETSSDYRREREMVVRLETWPVKCEITMISSLGIVHKCWHAYPSLSWRVGSLVTLSTRLKQPLPPCIFVSTLMDKGLGVKSAFKRPNNVLEGVTKPPYVHHGPLRRV